MIAARIRPAQARDGGAIRTLLSGAFAGTDEADLVEQLRADGDMMIEHVADEGGRVVGHVALSRMQVDADGAPIAAFGLAPVAVAPDRQRSGIGSELIRDALAAAAEHGARIVFLLGDPAYYRRFGFDAAAAEPFDSPYAGPHFMARWLCEPVTPGVGRATYAPAFGALR